MGAPFHLSIVTLRAATAELEPARSQFCASPVCQPEISVDFVCKKAKIVLPFFYEQD
jgi:hypothetical protein